MRRRSSGLPSRRAHTSLGLAPEIDSDGGSNRPLSNGDDSPAEPIYGATSSLPQIKNYYSRQNERSALSQKVKQGLLDPTQYYIYAESYGGVEFYKKMARKAETAMQMEQKQYHSELERSNELINRLRARISALEALSDEREVNLETQKRKVRTYRHQIQYNTKAYEKDVAQLRAQLEHSDKKLALFTEESKRKMLDLRHEFVKREAALEMFQDDMVEITKSIEEPLESFFLPDYFSPKLGTTRKTEGIRIATQILRLRVENDDMMKNVKSRDTETSSLLEEVKSLRKEADETSKLREAAASSSKLLQGLTEKLEGLNRLVTSSSLLRGVEDTSLAGEKSQDKFAPAFSKLRAALQLLISKADAVNKTSTVLQIQHEKCTAVVGLLREDLGLPKSEQNVDFYGLLAAVREQVRRKIDSLQNLQNEKSSVDAAVTKNVSKARQLEKSLDELTQKQRRVKLEKDKLADALAEVQNEKATLEKQLLRLQSLFLTLSSSLQAGSYGTIMEAVGSSTLKIPSFDEEKEVGSIVGSFESLVAEKSRLESKVKKGNDQVLELIEVFQKTSDRKVDPIAELPSVILKVIQLKKDSEMVSGKLKAAESELGDMGKKKDSQLDSTLQKVSEACDGLKASTGKLRSLFEDGVVASNPKVTAIVELGKVAADLSTLVPKVLDLKKERDSLVSKLAEVERQGLEEQGHRKGTEKHVDAIRQSLIAIQSLNLADLGKNLGELDDLAFLEKIKQELVSSKDTKEKAVVRAHSLTLQASQLDPVVAAIGATVQQIQDDTGGTSVEQPKGQDTTKRLEFVRDRLTDLKVSISTKVHDMSEEIEDLKGKVKLLDGVLKNSEKKWSDRVELVKKELLRLGGCDIDNKVENAKKLEAAGRVKDFLLRAKQSNDASVNPLSRLATFHVELLVNNKVHGQLQVGGTMNGLSQAAVHYFRIESQSGEVTFENAAIPGSQSSNMLVELVLNSAGNVAVYESKAGDVLGLSVKVTAIDDQAPREILYNSNVIHTDEVMDAIKGQTLDNFSLWPDLVSSWKWERTPNGWTLITIKWRFLLKSIFPELSEPLQTLAIANRPVYDRSQTIRTLAPYDTVISIHS